MKTTFILIKLKKMTRSNFQDIPLVLEPSLFIVTHNVYQTLHYHNYEHEYPPYL